jgi:hypothetical protein
MRDLILALLSVLLLFIAFGVPLILRSAVDRRRKYEEQAQIFHQKVEALAEDDETPDVLLAGMEGFNDTINTTSGGRALFRLFLKSPSQRKRSAEIKAKSYAEFEEVRPFLERRPELARAMAEAIVAWLFAVMYNAEGLKGGIARVLFLNSVGLMDPSRLARRVFEGKILELKPRKPKPNHNHHDHHASAAA